MNKNLGTENMWSDRTHTDTRGWRKEESSHNTVDRHTSTQSFLAMLVARPISEYAKPVFVIFDISFLWPQNCANHIYIYIFATGLSCNPRQGDYGTLFHFFAPLNNDVSHSITLTHRGFRWPPAPLAGCVFSEFVGYFRHHWPPLQ